MGTYNPKTVLRLSDVKGMRRVPLNVAIRVRPTIVRSGEPRIGSCFFDPDGRLIYIVAYDARRGWYWRRVFTDGSLSTKEYSGFWTWDYQPQTATRARK